MKVCIDNQDLQISRENFYFFVGLFNREQIAKKGITIGITGSGGSGIPKPNIGTIAALYLSRIPDLYVIKTGSSKKTGIMGSTDIMKKIGYYNITNRKNFYERTKFYYSDIEECAKWKCYANILTINKTIKNIMNSTLFNEYFYDLKITGCVSKKTAEKMCERIIFNKPTNWYIYGGYIDNHNIDEFVPEKNFIIHDGKVSEVYWEKKYAYSSNVNVNEINRELLLGEYKDGFWLESLKYTIAFTLCKSKVVKSYEEGIDAFERIYKEKSVKSLMKDM